MPSRCLSTRLVRLLSIGATSLAFVGANGHLALAQDKSLAPRDVKVAGNGTGATVSWSAVEGDGVTYRVLRLEKGARGPVDVTRPVTETSVVDASLTAGTPYSYQVMAVLKDGTYGTSEPVDFTLPSLGAGTPIIREGVGRIVPPTAVNGVTVTGTITSAVVSWQPVPGAEAYSVSRQWGGNTQKFSGVNTPFTDNGMQGIGFTSPGVYTYTVVANLPGGAQVSGQNTWTRPDPSCAAPPASQPMLAVLTPGTPTLEMSFPSGVGLSWPPPFKNSPVVAFRVDRSAQGSNTWTQVATTCDPSVKQTTNQYSVIDTGTGVAPNTTYTYRLMALAVNGEAGSTTISWTSPNTSTLRWLSSSVAGNTVTLKYRYEPPTSNAPSPPFSRYYLTTPYGLNQMVPAPSGGCTALAGCTVIVNNVPAGTHVFTLTASWTDGVTKYANIKADTTVIVP